MSKKWRELSEYAKEPFKIQHAKEKEAYDEKVQAYNDAHPKKPKTSFIRYFLSIRETLKEENPEAKFTDLPGLAAKKWKALSDAEKKPFVDAFNAERNASK